LDAFLFLERSFCYKIQKKKGGVLVYRRITAETTKKKMIISKRPPIPNPPIINPPKNVPNIVPIPMETCRSDIALAKSPLPTISVIHAIGVGINDCALVSRQISLIMDVDDVIHHSYLLEVSSPGLARPLRRAEHFEKVIGQQVKVKTHNLIEDRKIFIGRLKALSQGTIILWDNKMEKEITIPLDNINKANLEFIEKGD